MVKNNKNARVMQLVNRLSRESRCLLSIVGDVFNIEFTCQQTSPPHIWQEESSRINGEVDEPVVQIPAVSSFFLFLSRFYLKLHSEKGASTISSGFQRVINMDGPSSVKVSNTDYWFSISSEECRGPQILEDSHGRENVFV